jgi:hypothetical protein
MLLWGFPILGPDVRSQGLQFEFPTAGTLLRPDLPVLTPNMDAIDTATRDFGGFTGANPFGARRNHRCGVGNDNRIDAAQIGA